MILINNIKLPLDTDFNNLKKAVASALKTDVNTIISAKLYRKSVDARHKYDVFFCCSLLVECTNEDKYLQNNNVQKYNKKMYEWLHAKNTEGKRPVIVGFGPAGMFAGLTLAYSGLKPIIIERGNDADKRTEDVSKFLKNGILDEESNVQFGEGGAGTFSDGKLNTGIKDMRCRTVLELFVKFGAPEEILTDSKPHIGTDILVKIVKNIRNEIIKNGGEIHFHSKLENIVIKNGRLYSIVFNHNEIECDHIILATGHSSRDTYQMLKNNEIQMERKPFAMGVRIEHSADMINKSMYGNFSSNRALHAADYKLSKHLQNGRGVYTFCMCPGGEVINASSEKGGIAINGMSNSRRDGRNSNSAVLVGVNPDDIDGSDILGGCILQRNIEQTAYSLFNGAAPVSTVGSFLYNDTFKITNVIPTVLPSYHEADFDKIFPKFITDSIRQGIVQFDKQISGFASNDSVLTAPETRSSSPVRITRNESGESVSLYGLYPCGEGAGYAGGIVSSAVDGMKAAESVINSYCH